MALIFNQETVSPEAVGPGARRQALLDDRRVENIDFRLERITLDAGASHDIRTSASSLAWLAILDGDAQLIHDQGSEKITSSHVVFVPPSFSGRIESVGSNVCPVSARSADRRLDS
jgi:mannose-6-phosphate isomerase class I